MIEIVVGFIVFYILAAVFMAILARFAGADGVIIIALMFWPVTLPLIMFCVVIEFAFKSPKR